MGDLDLDGTRRVNVPTPSGAVAAGVAPDLADGPARFNAPGLFDWLEAAAHSELDALHFGLIAMAQDGAVEHYNAWEGQLSGLTPERVIGRQFFTSVAPCTNNFMVAHRFETEPEIDAEIDYVFTFRLAPRRVRLRLLKRPGGRRMYLAVTRPA
jgi:photoactive yellow protein